MFPDKSMDTKEYLLVFKNQKCFKVKQRRSIDAMLLNLPSLQKTQCYRNEKS